MFPPHASTRTDEESLLMEEQREQFPGMEATPGEDAVKTGNDSKGLRIRQKPSG